MAGFDYPTYVTNLGGLMVVATTDANFTSILPRTIDYAEQRMYRELDLLNTVQRATTVFATGTRTLNLPTAANGTLYVINEFYVITPFGQTNPDLGTRNTLVPVSRPFLDGLYPSSNGSGVPQYFAPTTQTSVVVGPWPDQAYTVDISATTRPPALSSTNVTTLLTVYFPDVFIAASMIFMSGYLQNFGAQGADNPNMPTSWEATYQNLLKSAAVEEARKKFTSQGWSSKQPEGLTQRS